MSKDKNVTIDGAKIILTIHYNWGEGDVTLSDWLHDGPGSRPLLQPVEAQDKASGGNLPLSVIPFRYRNTWLSRMLIRLRIIQDPWNA